MHNLINIARFGLAQLYRSCEIGLFDRQWMHFRSFSLDICDCVTAQLVQWPIFTVTYALDDDDDILFRCTDLATDVGSHYVGKAKWPGKHILMLEDSRIGI